MQAANSSGAAFQCILHQRCVGRQSGFQARRRAFQFGDDCWVEQLKVKTTLPTRPVAALPSAENLDLEQLLDNVTEDPEFKMVLAELIQTVKAKLPKDIQEEFLAEDLQKKLAEEARALLSGALS